MSDIEFLDVLYGSGQYSLIAAHHNRPLKKLGMFCHKLQQLLLAQVSPIYSLFIYGFLGAQYVAWFQPCAVQ